MQTLNPFNDRLKISLGNLSLDSAAAAGAVRLTSNETARGAIELYFNGTKASLAIGNTVIYLTCRIL